MKEKSDLNYVFWLCEHIKGLCFSKYAFNNELLPDIVSLLESINEELESL